VVARSFFTTKEVGNGARLRLSVCGGTLTGHSDGVRTYGVRTHGGNGDEAVFIVSLAIEPQGRIETDSCPPTKATPVVDDEPTVPGCSHRTGLHRTGFRH
jgi:hypothetical protein